MTQITVYGRPMCGMLPKTRMLLRLGNIPYTYVNIHQDIRARERVRQINNGNESVPTLEFGDGTTLTEPSGEALRSKLSGLGYRVPMAWIDGVLQQMTLVIVGIFALLGGIIGASSGNVAAGVGWGVAAGFIVNTLILQFAGR
jgi:mycoredoxin